MRYSKTGTAFDLNGPPDAPVLLLVHGLGLTRGTWDAHVPVLAQDYRVLTYDLAGHGQSPRPQDKPSLTLLSEQLVGLMDDLPLERIWRDARVERIWEGTSEIQRHIISRELLRAVGG